VERVGHLQAARHQGKNDGEVRYNDLRTVQALDGNGSL
jgi:hypothetical protein